MQTSKWPSTYILIHGCFEPQCNLVSPKQNGKWLIPVQINFVLLRPSKIREKEKKWENFSGKTLLDVSSVLTPYLSIDASSPPRRFSVHEMLLLTLLLLQAVRSISLSLDDDNYLEGIYFWLAFSFCLALVFFSKILYCSN